jgi:pyruvate/2-oxoglutarate dehydrogenase complex dihydrolipoamide dehydrogenase (E3) component
VIKVITSRTSRVLGAGIVDHDASELVALWSLAVAESLTIGAVARLVPPYPPFGDFAATALPSMDPV